MTSYLQFFSSQPSLLLVAKCEIPEDPLAVGNVQNLADELSGPLFSVNPVISYGKVLVLPVKEMPGNPAFHEVFQPAMSCLSANWDICGDIRPKSAMF